MAEPHRTALYLPFKLCYVSSQAKGRWRYGFIHSAESVDEDKSIVTDYQFEQNTHSDSDFLKEHLESVEKTPEHITMVTDGAYSSEENRQLAKSNGQVRASFPKKQM